MSARWVPATVPSSAALLAAGGLPRRLAQLLALRGIADLGAAHRYLTPARDDLHPPHLLAGLPAAVDRLATACEDGDTVAVVGDYDVDGIAATALLVAILRSAGARPVAILARRHQEGYGFQSVHVQRSLEHGARVLITVDCGTNSRQAAAEAARRGLDLIVTDHHLPDGDPPAEAILINPKQPGCSYPNRHLTGAGLALKLGVALLEARGAAVPWDSLLRVACLGTIADVAPLTGENRVIAALGLAALAETRSAGLRALFESARVQPPIRAIDVGFRLAPRLNAAGRLGLADPALELLLERDPARARELAGVLERANRERQELESRAVEEAKATLERAADTSPIAIAWSGGWSRGVVGIAAAKLARDQGRPVILLAVDGELATGSGRSVSGIHLHDFLLPWQQACERFGGHAQAIGLTVRTERLAGLADEWRAAAAAAWPAAVERTIPYDLELAVDEVGLGLVEQIERLEPFGEGNAEPMFRIGPLAALGAARAFGNGHCAVVLGDPASRSSFEGVGWGWRDRLRSLPPRLEVLARLERDTYRGGVRANLVDLRPLAADGAN